jgi:UTP--glucose-1-phosphate uridylyltransferase
LTDAIAQDADRVALSAFRFSGTRYDCGSHDGLIEAGIARQARVKACNLAQAMAMDSLSTG